MDSAAETTNENSKNEPQERGRNLLLESGAIFLSVLLAFLVEQWRDDQKELEEAEAAMGLVAAELSDNLRELQRVEATRREMLEVYLAAMDELRTEGIFPTNLPPLDIPEITTIAYDLATDSGAVTQVEPESLLVIARAYEALEDVKRNDLFLIERNAQIRFNDGEQYVSGFIYFVNTASVNEPVAIKHVQAALALLGDR